MIVMALHGDRGMRFANHELFNQYVQRLLRCPPTVNDCLIGGCGIEQNRIRVSGRVARVASNHASALAVGHADSSVPDGNAINGPAVSVVVRFGEEPLHMNRKLVKAFCVVSMVGVAIAGCAGGSGSGNNPSPVAGGATSTRTNNMADRAAHRPIEYSNAAKKGPALVVLPGEIRSNNATFGQHIKNNNIADWAEIELTRANFSVLERQSLGSLLREAELAYNMSDAKTAAQLQQKGNLRTTRWIMKFDILRAEQIAEAGKGFDGGTIGGMVGSVLGGTVGSVARQGVGSVKTSEGAGVWLVGLRYRIIDAKTTEQVAQGYVEDKMEIGRVGSSALGVSSSAKGGTTLDTLVQRLVQASVAEIDAKHK